MRRNYIKPFAPTNNGVISGYINWLVRFHPWSVGLGESWRDGPWWTLFSLDSVVLPVGLKVNLDLFGGFSWLMLIWTWLPSTMKLTFSHLKMDGWKTFAFPFWKAGLFSGATVDGRNPAPVDMVIIPSYTGFYTSQVVSRISSINSMLVTGRVILDLFKGYLQKITVRLTEANRWGYCSLGWCLRRWWRGGTRMVWGVVMSQWEGRVKKGRKDPKFGMRCMELMALVWYGASIWPASVHASRISASSLVCCIAMSRSNSHEIPWKSYHPLKLT